MKEKQRHFVFRIALLTALLWMSCVGLSACVGGVPRTPVEALFSPTPTLTPTPTILWFPATVTPTRLPIVTNTPIPDVRPDFGALIFDDQVNTSSHWQDYAGANGSIQVKEGSVTLAIQASRGTLTSLRSDTQINDFYFESMMNVSLCKVDDYAGVLFRVVDSQDYYRLLINCQGMVTLQQVSAGAPSALRDWSISSQIQQGLPSPLKIGVWASGQKIRIYLNDQLQFESENELFAGGGLGFTARSAGDTPVTVRFSSIQVYSISQ